jgi:hypothetical protein
MTVKMLRYVPCMPCCDRDGSVLCPSILIGWAVHHLVLCDWLSEFSQCCALCHDFSHSHEICSMGQLQHGYESVLFPLNHMKSARSLITLYKMSIVINAVIYFFQVLSKCIWPWLQGHHWGWFWSWKIQDFRPEF